MQEIEQLLTFVIVGGGPTGVEVAAELHDLIYEDLKKVYPQLMSHVAIKLVELQDHVLGTYDRAISDFTKGEFERCPPYLPFHNRSVTGLYNPDIFFPFYFLFFLK
jgi:NADH:ubiquinone reductase (non-electrogenic)